MSPLTPPDVRSFRLRCLQLVMGVAAASVVAVALVSGVRAAEEADPLPPSAQRPSTRPLADQEGKRGEMRRQLMEQGQRLRDRVLGDEADGRPVDGDDSEGRRGFRGERGPGDRPDNDGGGWRPGREFRELLEAARQPENMEAAVAFFQEHSPFRYKLYTDFEARAEDEQDVAVAKLRQKMTLRYLHITSLGERYGEGVRQSAIKRVELEDRIAELALSFEAADDQGAKERVREELRGVVRELIEMGLIEREQRLNRLRSKLDEEAAKLNAEREALNDEAARQAEDILAGDLPPMLQFDGDGPARDDRRDGPRGDNRGGDHRR